MSVDKLFFVGHCMCFVEYLYYCVVFVMSSWSKDEVMSRCLVVSMFV